ncbi:MAG: hypothetical protein P8R54_30455 [Myxococcota bacterium]|nr:hypothetical protein [Myxococcota bacterium]
MEFNQAFNISRGLEHGFAAFKRAPLPLFLGGMLMQCTEGGSGNSSSSPGSIPWDTDGGSRDMDYDYRMDLGELLRADIPPTADLTELIGLAGVGMGFILGMVLLGVVCIGLLWVFRSWLHVGYIRTQSRSLLSGEGSFGDLLSGTDRLPTMMLWKLLKMLITTGALLVAAAPGGGILLFGVINENTPLLILGAVVALLLGVPVMVYIGLGLAFGEHAVTLDELGPTEALERSWELASGNRLHLFLFLLVYGFLRLVSVFVGLLMLCIGVLFTVPITRAVTDTGFTSSYLLLTNKTDLDQLAGVPD